MSNPPKLKTREEAKSWFHKNGITIFHWAKEHEVHPNTVYEVLGGRKKGLRGDAHKVAVLLGMKAGVVDENNS